MRRTSRHLVAVAALLSLPIVGCAASESAEPAKHHKATTGAGGSGAGADDLGDPEVGGGGSGPSVCPSADGVYVAEPAPSNVLFLLDRSGSMHLRIGNDETRWTATKAGLFELVDTLPSDTSAGLVMFPRGDAPVTCCAITAGNYIDCSACGPYELPGTEARCDSSWYTTPPVGVGALDAGHRAELKDFVSSADDEFYWGTPLAPALEGAIQYQIEKAAPGVSSIILLTDGNPTSCDTAADPGANDIQRVADAAAAGFGASTPVRTFVLGVIDGDQGANAANLSLVASAGGTGRYAGCEANGDCAYPINVATFASDIQAALHTIALEAFTCTFDVPEVQGGQPDLDSVNITITSNATTTTIQKDSSHTSGWDYLPNAKQVQLYGDACTMLKADDAAKVSVVVGCKTVGQ